MKAYKRNFLRRAPARFLALVMALSIFQSTALALTEIKARQICGKTEHTHSEECYGEVVETSEELVCGLEETEGHTHGDACYSVLTERGTAPECGLEETVGHAHGEGCYDEEGVLTCTEPEVPGHTHGDTCYPLVSMERVLTCTEPEVPGHTHSEDCHVTTVTKELICGTEVHEHTKDCYEGYAEGLEGDVTLENALSDALKGDDKRVVLILNGVTMQTNRSIEVGNGYTLDIQDGVVTGGTIDAGKAKGEDVSVIIIQSGGAVNLTGDVTITGGHAKKGGGVKVNGGTFYMENGVITENTAKPEGTYDAMGQGGGVYVTGATGSFTMNGGEISGNRAGEGGGVFIDSAEKGNETHNAFTMTNGVVDGNIATLGEGGGIYICGTGTITGGAITNNETHTSRDLGGGGIYVESSGKLQIKNVLVFDNEAAGLGGGLAACVHGKTIVNTEYGAAIFDNKGNLGQEISPGTTGFASNVNGFVDGNRIWMSDDVFKDVANDVFTASTAKDGNSSGTPGVLLGNAMLGGGQASYTGKAFVETENGKYVVTTNSGVNNKNSTDKRNMLILFPEGGSFEKKTEKDSKGNEITYYMLKDGKDNYVMAADGKTPLRVYNVRYDWTDVSGDGVIYADKLLGVTANPNEAAKQAAKDFVAQQGGVIVSGNKSLNSHGGGIANNGTLVIGEMQENFASTDSSDLTVDKTLVNTATNEKFTSLENWNFTFNVTDENGNVVGAMTSGKDGKASFRFPADTFQTPLEDNPETEENENEVWYIFYVTEEEPVGAGVDRTQYMVKIRVTSKTETVTIGTGSTKEITTVTVNVEDPVIYRQAVDENGELRYDESGAPVWSETPLKDGEGISFTNTYTPPPEEPDPEDPEDPDPEDPDPEDPEDPDPEDPDPEDPEDPDPEDPDPEDPEDPDPEDPEDPDPEDPVYPPYNPPDTPPFTPPAPTNPTPTPTPPVEIPDPEVPRVSAPEEAPMEEILDGEVPLAEEPEEPEEPEEELVEIPDEDVPLADVPHTGDLSGVWYVLALLAAAGLLILRVLESRSRRRAD